jgi:hypothetical protein
MLNWAMMAPVLEILGGQSFVDPWNNALASVTSVQW